MTPSNDTAASARMPEPDLEILLARAAEEGARRALADVGLGGKDAVLTIHDMRSLGIMYQRHQARMHTPSHRSAPPSRCQAPEDRQ